MKSTRRSPFTPTCRSSTWRGSTTTLLRYSPEGIFCRQDFLIDDDFFMATPEGIYFVHGVKGVIDLLQVQKGVIYCDFF